MIVLFKKLYIAYWILLGVFSALLLFGLIYDVFINLGGDFFRYILYYFLASFLMIFMFNWLATKKYNGILNQAAVTLDVKMVLDTLVKLQHHAPKNMNPVVMSVVYSNLAYYYALNGNFAAAYESLNHCQRQVKSSKKTVVIEANDQFNRFFLDFLLDDRESMLRRWQMIQPLKAQLSKRQLKQLYQRPSSLLCLFDLLMDQEAPILEETISNILIGASLSETSLWYFGLWAYYHHLQQAERAEYYEELLWELPGNIYYQDPIRRDKMIQLAKTQKALWLQW